MSNTKHFATEQELTEFAAQCASKLQWPMRIYFKGELGSGKTTFVRAMLRSLGITGAVKSPTFTLVEPYQIAAGHIYHFDLYRLADPEELEYLGIEDYLRADSIVLVEWPEKAGNRLPEADLEFCLSHAGVGRDLQINAAGNIGKQFLQAIQTVEPL